MKVEFLRAVWWTLRSWWKARNPPPLHGHRPGDDEQWRNWTGPNGRPVPLNDQAAADRADRSGP